MATVIKVPAYIRAKMRRVAELHRQSSALMRDIEAWLETHGVDTSEDGLRCGDGCSLEDLEYGIDITDLLCAKIEMGILPMECASSDCHYIRDGVCFLPVLLRREPEITEEEGCKDYFCRQL